MSLEDMFDLETVNLIKRDNNLIEGLARLIELGLVGVNHRNSDTLEYRAKTVQVKNKLYLVDDLEMDEK